MEKSFSWTDFLSEPRLWAPVVSFLMAIFMSYGFYINNDGIFYLKGAEAILNFGTQAQHLSLKWPFYPLLIAGFSYISGISLMNSALILQALLFALLIISFINIIKLLGGNKTIQILAALTLLLQPELNTERDSIIRDFGYWAFLFTAFYYFLRYVQIPNLFNLSAYTLCIAIATLFRIEGVVIIALTPLLGLLAHQKSWKERLAHTFYLYLPWLVIVSLLLTYFILYYKDFTLLGRLAELQQWWNYLNGSNETRTLEAQAQLRNIFPMIHNGLEMFFYGGFTFYLLYTLFITTHFVFLFLIIYGQFKHYLTKYINTSLRHILYGFLFINFLIPAVFVSKTWFLRDRFLIATALTLLLWVPFTVYEIYKRWQQSRYFDRYKYPAYLLCTLAALALFIDGIYSFNTPSSLIKESAAWMRNNTPENASVYSNNPPMAFYINRPGIDLTQHPIGPPLSDALSNLHWQQYDYLAFFLKRHDRQTEALIKSTIPYPPIEEFQDKLGYKVIIYKVQK